MISVWWLLAIVPVSAIFGMMLGLLVAANGRSDPREDA